MNHIRKARKIKSTMRLRHNTYRSESRRDTLSPGARTLCRTEWKRNRQINFKFNVSPRNLKGRFSIQANWQQNENTISKVCCIFSIGKLKKKVSGNFFSVPFVSFRVSIDVNLVKKYVVFIYSFAYTYKYIYEIFRLVLLLWCADTIFG